MARCVSSCMALLLLSGCFTRTPKPVFYTLTPVAPPTAMEQNEDMLTLAVGPATLPLYLDRPQIATRQGNRLAYDEYRRWAASLESELLRVMGANLASMLETERVAIYPTQPRFDVSYRIALQIERFDGDPKSEVTLQVRWALRKPRVDEPASIGFSEIVVPVTGGDYDGYVDAHSEAVGALSRDIAARIRSLSE